MQIEYGFLAIALAIAIGVGVLLYWVQRPVLSLPRLVATGIGVLFAVYYILHVVFGTGRTGWP